MWLDSSVSTCIAAFGWIWPKVHSLQNAVALNGKRGRVIVTVCSTIEFEDGSDALPEMI